MATGKPLRQPIKSGLEGPAAHSAPHRRRSCMTIPALRRMPLVGPEFLRLSRERPDLRARLLLGHPHVVGRAQVHLAGYSCVRFTSSAHGRRLRRLPCRPSASARSDGKPIPATASGMYCAVQGGAYPYFLAQQGRNDDAYNVLKCLRIYILFRIVHYMETKFHETFRRRRLALGLSQAETARRSGIQQRQVSLFERGGDVTLATLAKLAQALDLELLPVPREAAAKVESLLTTQRERAPAAIRPASIPSLLERYQVTDDEEPSHG